MPKTIKKPVKKIPKKIKKTVVKKIIAKPKKEKKIITVREIISKPTPKPDAKALDDLVAKVRPRGFVTETELLQVFPQVENYIYDYELTLERLQRNSIRIIEDSGGFLDVDANVKKAGQLTSI